MNFKKNSALFLIIVLIISLTTSCNKQDQLKIEIPVQKQQEEPQQDEKGISVTIKVIDGDYSKEYIRKTEKATLGDFLVEIGIAIYDNGPYGKFITGIDGRMADKSIQQWWSILVNGETATTGVDAIKLNENFIYTFEMKTGY